MVGIGKLSMGARLELFKITYVDGEPKLDVRLRKPMHLDFLMQNRTQSLCCADHRHLPPDVLGFYDYISWLKRWKVGQSCGGILLLTFVCRRLLCY